VTDAFELDSRLGRDSIFLTEDSLCQLRLMNDRRFPWILLIPKIANIREIYELSTAQQRKVWNSSALLAQSMSTTFQATKINIAALGNVVPQLHIHHIARLENDSAWPHPVWCYVSSHPGTDHQYNPSDINDLIERLDSSPLSLAFDLSKSALA
jgi:diadenosine tetraphosphate (Ap4A) HIT family hydrolase